MQNPAIADARDREIKPSWQAHETEWRLARRRGVAADCSAKAVPHRGFLSLPGDWRPRGGASALRGGLVRLRVSGIPADSRHLWTGQVARGFCGRGTEPVSRRVPVWGNMERNVPTPIRSS